MHFPDNNNASHVIHAHVVAQGDVADKTLWIATLGHIFTMYVPGWVCACLRVYFHTV